MDELTLGMLISKEIDPDKFITQGMRIIFKNPEDETEENLGIIANVKANYETLAAALTTRNEILKQIIDLEAQQTPRRLREAIAGTDNGWLASLEAQIAALRAQL